MKTSLECMECNVKQLIKVSNLLKVSNDQKEEATRKLFKVLSDVTFEYSNPYVMGKTFDVIKKVYQNDNPYKEIKSEYNHLILEMVNELEEMIDNSSNRLDTALRLAVVGNLIDFGARHSFDKDALRNRINNQSEIEFAIDFSNQLLHRLRKAKSLFYIGDNCGEIVFDKLFIEEIKKANPDIVVNFAVRGDAILNDVTLDDALEVGMDKIANIVSSKMAVPGTILSKTPKEFQNLFHESDIVIAKGQGNYESLSDIKRNDLYLILMAKCQYVANTVGANLMDYIVLENK